MRALALTAWSPTGRRCNPVALGVGANATLRPQKGHPATYNLVSKDRESKNVVAKREGVTVADGRAITDIEFIIDE